MSVTRLSSRFSIPTVAALLLGGLIAAAPAAAADPEPNASIKYRKNVMSAVGANMKSIAMIVKGEVPGNNMARLARGLALAAESAVTTFQPDTNGKGSEKTTAKASIWSDWAKFESGLNDLVEAANGLVKLANAGKTSDYGGQLRKIGGTCKACHDDFRNK